MAIFKLNEEKLRAAFAASKEGNEPEGYSWVAPFDPMWIGSDGLDRIVDDCLERNIIERDDPRAMMAIYPLSIDEPEPLLSVNPGNGPMLLGGEAIHHVSEAQASTPEDRSVIALRALVEDANSLYAESEVAKRGLQDGGSEGCCESCLRVHGPIQACLIGVLAGCIDERGSIDPIAAEEIAAIAVDPIWDRFCGLSVDYLEAQIREGRAAREADADSAGQ